MGDVTDIIGGVIGLAVLAGAVWIAFNRGQSKEKQRAKEASQQIAENIDEAVKDSHDYGYDWRERLRKHTDLSK